MAARYLARTAYPMTVVIALLLVLAGGVAGCSGGGTTTSSVAPTTTTVAESSSTMPPAYATPESNALARELKRTAGLSAQLGQLLQDQGVAADDPRIGMVWALRARGQAVVARKAILEKQPELADDAVKELRIQLARAAAIADKSVVATVTQAAALMPTVGKPSGDPVKAAAALDNIMKVLEPLIAQGQALLPSDPSTTTAGT